MIEFSIDPEANSAYLKVREGEFSKNEDLGYGIIVDLDQDGNVLGIEILGVASAATPRPVPEPWHDYRSWEEWNEHQAILGRWPSWYPKQRFFRSAAFPVALVVAAAFIAQRLAGA